MRERQGRDYWLVVIQRFEGSDMSQTAFSSRHRLNIGTFRSWLYRLRGEGVLAKKKKTAKFLEVCAAPKAADTKRCLVRVGQIEVEFNELPPAMYLSDLVASLCLPPK